MRVEKFSGPEPRPSPSRTTMSIIIIVSINKATLLFIGSRNGPAERESKWSNRLWVDGSIYVRSVKSDRQDEGVGAGYY